MINNTSGNTYYDTEHYLQRMLAGNVNDVSRRLIPALERLDYDVIDEGDFEIQARRNERGWAGAYLSADVLDYPRTLIIKFKPVNENLTRVSFIYIVKHSWLQAGEKEVLTREAETLSALATVNITDKLCAVCGAESNDDSRFCRKCGVSLTRDESVIKNLQMTAETRSGHTSVVIGTVCAALVLLISIIGIVVAAINGFAKDGFFILLINAVILSLGTVISNSFAWRRLNKALKTERKDPQPQVIINSKNPQIISSENHNALPPPAAYSVIEGTTELLDFNKRTADLVEHQTDEKTN